MSLSPYRLTSTARAWNWMDDGVLPLLTAVIRLCWLWPWLEVLRRWLTPVYPTPWLPLWAIPMLLVGGVWTARLVLSRTPDLRTARIGVALIGVLVSLSLVVAQIVREPLLQVASGPLTSFSLAMTDVRYGLPPALLTLLVAAAMWLRGVQDAQRRRTRDDVWATSGVAYGAFALLALVGQLDTAGLPEGAVGWMIVLVAVSLTALALSSLELARSVSVWGEREPNGRGAMPALSRDWLVGVGLVIVAVLGVGLLLGVVFTPGAVAQALGWVAVLVRWIGLALGYVAVGIAFLLFLLLTPLINWLMDQVGEPEPREPVEQAGFQQQFEEFTGGAPVELAPEVVESLRWLGIVGIVVVIAVVFAVALRFFRAERDEELAETRETILSRALLQEQLAALWKSWLARLQQHAAATISPYLSLRDEEECRRDIRAVYQTLLDFTNALGTPHQPDQTPVEYQARLAEAWPDQRGEWKVLTEVYVAARYGAPAPSPEQVTAMRAAWLCVQAALTVQDAATGGNPAGSGSALRPGDADLNQAG